MFLLQRAPVEERDRWSGRCRLPLSILSSLGVIAGGCVLVHTFENQVFLCSASQLEADDNHQQQTTPNCSGIVRFDEMMLLPSSSSSTTNPAIRALFSSSTNNDNNKSLVVVTPGNRCAPNAKQIFVSLPLELPPAMRNEITRCEPAETYVRATEKTSIIFTNVSSSATDPSTPSSSSSYASYLSTPPSSRKKPPVSFTSPTPPLDDTEKNAPISSSTFKTPLKTPPPSPLPPALAIHLKKIENERNISSTSSLSSSSLSSVRAEEKIGGWGQMLGNLREMMALATNRTSIVFESGENNSNVDASPHKKAVSDSSSSSSFPSCFSLPPALANLLPSNFLLIGEEGIGKSCAVRAVCDELGLQCLSLSRNDLRGSDIGDDEQIVKAIFEKGEEKSGGCVILIEELDRMFPKREGVGERSARLVAQLLTLMDGAKKKSLHNGNAKSNRSLLCVVGTTSNPNFIDAALRRPGRFDREIRIPPPTEEGRREILDILLNDRKNKKSSDVSPKVDIVKLAQETVGFVGADLASMIKQARLCVISRESRKREERERKLLARRAAAAAAAAKTSTSSAPAAVVSGAKPVEESSNPSPSPAATAATTPAVGGEVGVGMGLRPAPPGTGSKGGGFVVSQVVPGGGAEAAGILVGDIIVAVDKLDLTRKPPPAAPLIKKAMVGEGGTFVLIKWTRAGKKMEKSVERIAIAVAASSPAPPPSPAAAAASGNAVAEQTAASENEKQSTKAEKEAETKEEEKGDNSADDDDDDDFLLTMTDLEEAIRLTIPSGLRGLKTDLPPVTWDSIGGYESVKLKIKQCVEWPLVYSKTFVRLGIEGGGRGVLLHGPPGCCKTTLVRAVASQSRSCFLTLNCSEVFSCYLGEAERIIRSIFQRARVLSPTVLFFDEIDAIVGSRSSTGGGGGGGGMRERILATFLNEMDGVEVANGVFVVGATNRLSSVDAALLRPGRFDHVLHVPLPNEQERLAILKVHTQKMELGEGVDLINLASKTPEFSGAELERLCQESALIALRRDISTRSVSLDCFEQALQNVKPAAKVVAAM